jgi:hypothetical protein
MVFIELLASAPKAGANDSNDLASIGEPDSQDTLGYPTEAVITPLILAVPGIARYDPAGIEKCQLGFTE